MRIPLAPVPSRQNGDTTPPRDRLAAQSYRDWVAVECPREKPGIPPNREESRPANRFAGHPVPKPYTPPFGQ